VSVVLTLAFVEGALRIRQWMRYGSTGTALYGSRFDQASGLTVPLAGERTGTIAINSHGFRGPEFSVPKPPGMIRLAFLGASTTFCAEVSSNEAAWPHLVWQALEDRFPGAQLDYVNGAFPGYTVDSSTKNLRHRIRPLEPDVIVLYEGVNDLSRETRRLAEQQGILRGNVDDDNFLGRWWLTWSLVEKNLRLLARQRNATQEDAPHIRFDPREISSGFRTRLTALVRDAQQVAPLVAVATFSQKVRAGQSPEQQVHNSATHLYYMPFLAVNDIVRTFAEYNRVIREVAAETGALLIENENDIPADDEHFRDSVHFTDEGSRAMAQRVSRALIGSSALQRLIATTGHGAGHTPQRARNEQSQ
jgi:lysophospholipase L1-like esterase